VARVTVVKVGCRAGLPVEGASVGAAGGATWLVILVITITTIREEGLTTLITTRT
jgi:hypothetical protein